MFVYFDSFTRSFKKIRKIRKKNYFVCLRWIEILISNNVAVRDIVSKLLHRDLGVLAVQGVTAKRGEVVEVGLAVVCSVPQGKTGVSSDGAEVGRAEELRPFPVRRIETHLQ